MARENIEDVIKKVILGEGFLAENTEDTEITEGGTSKMTHAEARRSRRRKST